MHKLMTIAALLAAMAAHAGLDRIDADGVTETGGSPRYARMLPRTGTNGLLSATLLPPVADWASQPIARLYYAAAGAPTQGNGSPQYPFSTLAHALGHMAADSALLMAPGSYSGTGTVASGRILTLFGTGWQVRITSLTVTAAGSSADTTLDLHGLRVGTLTVNGGRVNIRLYATAIDALAGSASAATVTRMDMASRIGASTLTHVDRYAGYPTAPEATALVGDGGRKIVMSGARGVVVDGAATNTIAHLSDVADATNAVYAAMAALETADADIVGLVDAERTARTTADNALSNNFARAVAGLSEDINAVDSNWDTQLRLVMASVSGLETALGNLDTRHTGDVATLTASVAGVRTGYATADTTLRDTLRGEFANGLGELRDSVPGVARAQAGDVVDERLGATTNDVIGTAVARANEAALARESNLSGRIDGATNRITLLEARHAEHEVSLRDLTSADTAIRRDISGMQGDISDLEGRADGFHDAILALQAWDSATDTWKVHKDSDIATLRNKVNAIINSITPLTNRTFRAISVPSKLP